MHGAFQLIILDVFVTKTKKAYISSHIIIKNKLATKHK